VDDFGTGYSSLSYLKRLPVSEVKIDKSFVVTMDRDPDNASIVRSIVDLGANLGLRVVAEGIETLEIWRQLRDLGCDVGQGYLLSRPMPIADLPAWLVTYEADPLGGSRPRGDGRVPLGGVGAARERPARGAGAPGAPAPPGAGAAAPRRRVTRPTLPA
jgi:predicted signal transduction protein with EAL and GGDEF domain